MGNLIKLLISIALVGFILYKVDAGAVWNIIQNANLLYIAIGLVFLLLSQSLASFRWFLIMRLMHYPHKFLFYFKSYFKGTLFNQVLPTSIGGDAYRIAEVHSKGGRVRDAFYGVFIDRVVGLLGLLILSLSANLYESDLLPNDIFYLVNLILIAGFIGFFLLIALHKIPFFENYKLTHPIYELSKNFRLIYKTPKRISVQLFLSIMIHLLALVTFYSLGQAVGIKEPPSTYLALIPLVVLLTILPISFAGWGIREGALIALFMLIGIDQDLVLAMSLIYGILLIVAALPGLVFYLIGKHKFL